MTARGKLVEHEMLARDGRATPVGVLFEIVQRARDQGVVRDATPIEPGVSLSRLLLAGLARAGVCGHQSERRRCRNLGRCCGEWESTTVIPHAQRVGIYRNLLA